MSAALCTQIYCIMFLIALLFIGRKYHFKINVSIFIIFYLFVCSIFSYLYFDAVNGVFRDYDNITLLPYIYYFICVILTMYPVIRWDSIDKNSIEFTRRQQNILYVISVLIIICTIIPFIETMIEVPSSLNNRASMANIYDARLEGNVDDYLSFIGRKFFFFIWKLNNLIPILIFANLILPKKNKIIIIGLCLSLITIWMHSMILGGRSRLVQNAIFSFSIYLLFRNFFNISLKRRLDRLILILFSIASFFVILVTISRFITMDTDMTMWEWIGLYAGEGVLNFNSMLWDIDKTTGGYSTCALLMSLIHGSTVGVEDLWEVISKLGVPGNIFYTYVGSIYMDFNKVGTIIFLLLSVLIINKICNQKSKNQFRQLIFLSLWIKILMVGPIFYTYTTVDDQINLLISIIFAIYI